MTWYQWLFQDMPAQRRPRPLVVPYDPPKASAISPVEVPLPRERDDGLPHMAIDAP